MAVAWLAVVAAVLVSLGCGNRGDRAKPEPVPYDPAAADSLLAVLSRPCELTWCSGYLDGGSIGGTLVGTNGDSLEFCHDGRIRDVRPGQPLPSSLREVFIGARYFKDPGSIALASASPQETTFVVLLREAIDGVLPAAEQKRLHKIWYNYEVPVDDRRRAVGHLSREGWFALQALNVVKHLTQQRADGFYGPESATNAEAK